MKRGRSIGWGLARVLGVAAVAVVGAVGIVSILWPGSSPASDAPAETAVPAFRGEIQSFANHGEPRPLPEIAFLGPTGDKLTLADFRERVILLNFWASWCAPCLKEMPALDRLQAKLGKERFEVVAISIDRGDGRAAQSFFERLELEDLRLYRDPVNQSSRALAIRGLPTTLLIDPEGREIGRMEGAAAWDSAAAEALIRHYLGSPASPRPQG